MSVADLAAFPVGALFGALAGLRRARALHPQGRSYRARVVMDAAADAPPTPLLSRAGEHPGEIRFSRALGLPRGRPDLLGVGLRIHGPDGPQDVLVTSSGRRRRLRRIFAPAADFQQRPYTSALPYAVAGGRYVLYVLPDPGSPRPGGDDDLDRLNRAAATGALRFRLAAAPPGGPLRAFATVHVGAPLPSDDAVRLSPFTGDLEPVGLINRLRRRAYPMSQAVWSASRADQS
jgi:hypothetical protein